MPDLPVDDDRSGLRLAVGDAFAIVLFVVLGLTSHDEGVTASGIARTALPLLGAWFVVAIAANTYTRPSLRTLLLTWAIAIPIGVVIRAIALDRPADGSQLAFAIVALTVTLVFLLAWRGLAAVLASRARKRKNPGVHADNEPGR